MKLNQDCNNKLNVVVGKKYCIAFSYSTVIAVLDKENKVMYVTTEKYGTTTGRHRNRFIEDYKSNMTRIEYKTQSEINIFIKNML